MADTGTAKSFLEKWYGLVIGLIVFGLLALLLWAGAFVGIERKILDMNFRLRNGWDAFWTSRTAKQVQEGVTVREADPRVSTDITIVGVDERSLERFGRVAVSPVPARRPREDVLPHYEPGRARTGALPRYHLFGAGHGESPG